MEGKSIHIIEESGKVMKELFLGLHMVKWFSKMEGLCSSNRKEFYASLRDDNQSFIGQRCSNVHGGFMAPSGVWWRSQMKLFIHTGRNGRSMVEAYHCSYKEVLKQLMVVAPNKYRGGDYTDVLGAMKAQDTAGSPIAECGREVLSGTMEFWQRVVSVVLYNEIEVEEFAG